MMEGSKTRTGFLMINFLLVLTISASAFSLPSTMEFEDHIKRIIRSDDIDGYDIATVHAVNTATDEETGQTKRDIEAHADDPSSGQRTFSLVLSSGERLHMSLARRSIDTSGATFTELTEEGEREITLRRPRDCFFGGELEGQEGFASLAMCDGELMGAIHTAKRTYEIHSLHKPMEKRSDDDVTHVLVTWKEGQERERGLDDGIEIPEDDFIMTPDDTATDEASKRTVADRKVTIEIGDFVDSHYIKKIGKELGKTTNKQIIDYILLKWSKTHQAISNKAKVGWDITLRIVQITLWRTNPGNYKTSTSDTIGARMNKICTATQKDDKLYDQVTLHTADTSDRARLGLAWIGGICRPRYRCSAVRSIGTGSNTELHEFGHSMGLKHDGDMEGCLAEGKGFMRYSFTFLKCYRKRLDDFFKRSDKGCVYKNTNPKKVKVF